MHGLPLIGNLVNGVSIISLMKIGSPGAPSTSRVEADLLSDKLLSITQLVALDGSRQVLTNPQPHVWDFAASPDEVFAPLGLIESHENFNVAIACASAPSPPRALPYGLVLRARGQSPSPVASRAVCPPMPEPWPAALLE